MKTPSKRGISIDIFKEVHPVDGFTLSTIYKGYRWHKRYIGYTTRAAQKDFRQYVSEVSR